MKISLQRYAKVSAETNENHVFCVAVPNHLQSYKKAEGECRAFVAGFYIDTCKYRYAYVVTCPTEYCPDRVKVVL